MNNMRVVNLENGLVPSGEDLIEVTVSTAAIFPPAITDPEKTRYIRFHVESNPVRYRSDGTSPTASVGMPLAAGETYTWRRERWLTTEFIRSGAADAKLIAETLGC